MAKDATSIDPPKKPPLTEIFAWNENIFGLVAVAWGLVFWILGFESTTSWTRNMISFIISSGGLVLIIIQNERIRTFLDYQFPVSVIKRFPVLLNQSVLKLWPVSIILRGFNHFFFTVWWLFLGTIVTIRFDSLEDIRLVLYFGFAALHFDRFIRLIQWIRR